MNLNIFVYEFPFSNSTIQLQKIQSEYDIWGQTRHRNVLHFLGYSTDPELAPVPCFISPWMEHGTTLDYLEKNPNADILKLVRCHLISAMTDSDCDQLKGLAEGLVYLHQIPILHGDIRGVRTSRLSYCELRTNSFLE